MINIESILGAKSKQSTLLEWFVSTDDSTICYNNI